MRKLIKLLFLILTVYLLPACEHAQVVKADGSRASYTAVFTNAKYAYWTPESLTVLERDQEGPAVAATKAVSTGILINKALSTAGDVANTGLETIDNN